MRSVYLSVSFRVDDEVRSPQVQLEDSLVSTTTPGDASQYTRRGGNKTEGTCGEDDDDNGNADRKSARKRRGKNKKKERGAGWENQEERETDRAAAVAESASAASAAAVRTPREMRAVADAALVSKGGAKTKSCRAANFWKLSDDDVGDVEGEGNHPYAGKKSWGTTVEPKDDQGAGYFGEGLTKPKRTNTHECEPTTELFTHSCFDARSTILVFRHLRFFGFFFFFFSFRSK